MLEFLLALLTTATVGVLLVPLLRTRLPSSSRFEGELSIYRDQLAEIDRERAAGTLPAADASAARTEIERRILAAADHAEVPKPAASPTLHKLLPPALALLIPLLALGLYLQIGHPGVPSAPFVAGARPPAEQPPLDIAGMVAAARARVAAQPDDPDAQSTLGEALTVEADGTVPPSAVEAFTKALAARPGDPRALYYLGLHEAQSGDSRAALERWRSLEARSPPNAPYLPMLRAEMERVAKAAGIDMPQPSREQVEAMQSLTPEQRQQAIRGMVEGLAAKLKDNPNDRAGWLRLANAWKVLGENASAADAYAHADALGAVDGRLLADWAEVQVRQLKPGEAPSPPVIAVLERLEKAEPRNALALFYLGAASFAAGDKPAAARRWKDLLALLPPDAPIREMLQQRIKEAEAK
jgi:cytochrome c-type biogenesis protein CcmH